MLASILLHGVLLLAALSTATGALVSRGGGVRQGQEDAVVISLAGLRGGAKPQARAAPPTPADVMLQRLAALSAPADAASAQPNPSQDLDRLWRDLSRRPADGAEDGSGGRSDRDLGGRGSQAGALDEIDRARAGRDASRDAGAETGSKSTGRLWGQVEPCWRKLSQASSVPVTLEVTLTSKGLVALPPKIIRPAGAAASEARLVSEMRALRAVAGCMPYRGPLLADVQRPFRLDFGASR